MKRIAFQGERGAYSEIAALHHFGNKIKLLPSLTFDDVFNSVKVKKADFGIVPVENSLYGSIFETYDLLLNYSLYINGEINLSINHNLLAIKKYPLNSLTKIYSHSQALGQCSNFLKKLSAEKIPTYDTAGAAMSIKNFLNEPVAAIASKKAAEVYGLKIIKKNIQNNRNNFTRFLIISRKSFIPLEKETKTSICFELKSIPGALFKALSVFALREIDLVKIESRPIPHKPFQYLFYTDLLGNLNEKRIQNAIKHLEEISININKFGSYKTGKTYSS